MRNLTTAISATVTAILIGVLVANVASAARAADIEHTKAAQLAALNSSFDANDTASQLAAYQERYTEAYNQLAAAYNALLQRDAQYRDAMSRSEQMSAQLSAANATLDSQLAQAWVALQDAQTAVQSWQPGAASIVAAPDYNPAPVSAPARVVVDPPAPAAAAQPAAPAPVAAKPAPAAPKPAPATAKPAAPAPVATPQPATPAPAPAATPQPATPAPAPVATPAPTKVQYCHYDANHEWHCEDHPW